MSRKIALQDLIDKCLQAEADILQNGHTVSFSGRSWNKTNLSQLLEYREQLQRQLNELNRRGRPQYSLARF